MRAIREACGVILSAGDPEALTTQRIADVAGVNIASLYQYFPNKDAVLADYLESEASRVAERSATFFARIDDLSRHSLEHTVATIVELEVEQRWALLRLNPAFFERFPHGADVHSKVEALTRAQHNPGWEAWLPEFLATHRSRVRERDLELLAWHFEGALQGVITRLADRSTADVAIHLIKAELLYLLLSYLSRTQPSFDDCEKLIAALAGSETPHGPDSGDLRSQA